MVAKIVEAQTVSGNVELLRVNADEVVAETVSGDVDFSGEIHKGGDYDMKTLSGDVIMRIPKGAGAEITGRHVQRRLQHQLPDHDQGHEPLHPEAADQRDDRGRLGADPGGVVQWGCGAA